MAEKRATARQKQLLAARAGFCCEYCFSQSKFGLQTFSAEHIQPQARGGETTLDNMAFSCQGCNGYKGIKTTARDPTTKNVVPLYNPRQDRWEDYFEWSEDFLTIIGLTPSGRATVDLLRVNRAEVVNLRRVLHMVGEHPPRHSTHESR